MSFTVHYALGKNVLLLLLKPVMRLVMKPQYAGSPSSRTGTIWCMQLRNAALQKPTENACPQKMYRIFVVFHTGISRGANRRNRIEEHS